MARFANRSDAGRVLGEVLSSITDRREMIVLALPRGGVPVGYEVARRLGAPLDLFLVRKLGMPGREELAFGAIASGGVRVDNEEVLRHLAIAEPVRQAVEARERTELARREAAYRAGRPPLDVAGKTAVLVDDGLATGATMKAAVLGLKRLGPRAVIVAVPVASPEACQELAEVADAVVCAMTPQPFHAVGLWYDDFEQTTDAEVRQLLDAAAVAPGPDQQPQAGA